MGRWTNEHQDNVLTAKLKGLVGGAIRRSKLEKSELISYKHFVEDLDLGDSFTTTIIDILVQEMAARRLRSNPSDRRLIADQTAKSLRLLSTPLRVYQERRSTSRRRMSEYLTAPPEEMDLEEDDELEASPDHPPSLPEGVRVNSELFDAYNSGWAHRRAATAAPTPPLSDDASSPPSLFSLPGTNRIWGGLPPTGTTLSRQSSIRRLPRSRTVVDFNNFTAHRRTSARELHVAQSAPEDRSSSASPRATRRFFPLSSTRRHQSLQWVEPPVVSAGEGSSSSSTPEAEVMHPSFFTDPELMTVPATFYSYPSPSPNGRESRPRLRRGGVRPPESLLFHNDSASEEEGSVPTAPALSAVAEAGSYPTPGSSVGDRDSQAPAA